MPAHGHEKRREIMPDDNTPLPPIESLYGPQVFPKAPQEPMPKDIDISGLSHEEARKLIQEWDDLSETQRMRVTLHLQKCDECARFMAGKLKPSK